MRKVLSNSTGPRLVFSRTGRLQQLRTGTDNFAEQALTAEGLATRVCAGLTAGNARTDIYRITKGNLLQFVTLPKSDGSPEEAVLGFNGSSDTEPFLLNDPSMLYPLQTFHDDVAAALAWGNFAIRVCGAAKVVALAQFYEAILAGDVVVVPSPRHSKNPWKCPGVALVNLKELSEEERSLFNSDIGAFLELSFGS